MAAKPKESKEHETSDPYLESTKDPEIEKKVDAMMSMDSPKEPKPGGPPVLPTKKRSIAVKDESKAETEETPETITETSTESDADAETPLVPDDLLAKTLGTALESDDVNDPSDEPESDETIAESEPEKPSDSDEETVPAAEPTKDELGLEDIGTSKAVDEIIASEADELLAARDHDPATLTDEDEKSNSKGKKKSSLLSRWWHSKRARNTTLVLMLIAIIVAGIVPASRYFVLNNAGVRSAASINVLDETTGQPLKNVEFSLGGTSGKTDKEGTVKLTGLRLGTQTMSVKKAAFAEVSQPVTLGWGSNPLGEFRLKPVGTQYRITVNDFVSKKPIAKIEASSGQANARANEAGEIVITIPVADIDQEKIEIELTGEGLRTEKIAMPLGKQDVQLVQMVPARKQVFISKRSGTFDVYKVDVDGKNEEKVLSGSGSERPEAIALSIHPTKNIAALVSARDNSKNKDGYTLSNLTIIDLNDNAATTAAQSERIQMVGWIDNKLTYVKIASGASAASADRHRLISYDLDSRTEKELASTNYFNDILMVDKSIYYTPASYNVNGSVGLFKTNADGSNKKTIYDKEVWNLFRTSYDKLSVSMGLEWFDLAIGTDVLTRASSAPPILKSRVYVNNTDDSVSLWVDERDGKGVLLSYDTATKADKILQSQSGLKNPVRWLTNKHIIYRVNNNQETADYILNTDGGQPQKIRDVTDTAGIDRWYYY